MKLIWKILIGLFGLFLLFIVYIQFAPPPKFDIPVDKEKVIISTDSAVLARGEYMVYGPAHCASCHSSPDDADALEKGAKVALKGGRYFDIPIGKLYMPNITPDPETGIGKLSNEEIARSLRYSVNHKGQAIAPVMPFTYMSESDLSAIISYLRFQAPVKNEVPATRFNLLGKALQKFMLKPYKMLDSIPKQVEPAPDAVYGAYLANSVANCKGCHTPFNMNKMEYEGVPLSGGSKMIESKHVYLTPNITPDPKTGHMVNWTESQFLERFQAGRIFEDSPMPWNAFKMMSTDDLRAIYRYLQTVPACQKEVGPIVSLK